MHFLVNLLLNDSECKKQVGVVVVKRSNRSNNVDKASFVACDVIYNSEYMGSNMRERQTY